MDWSIGRVQLREARWLLGDDVRERERGEGLLSIIIVIERQSKQPVGEKRRDHTKLQSPMENTLLLTVVPAPFAQGRERKKASSPGVLFFFVPGLALHATPMVSYGGSFCFIPGCRRLGS